MRVEQDPRISSCGTRRTPDIFDAADVWADFERPPHASIVFLLGLVSSSASTIYLAYAKIVIRGPG
jgi:hypothetical protein